MNETYTELYEKLARVVWLLHQQRMITMMNCGPFADVSRGQGRVLAMLKIQPEISTKDLAYLLDIRQQSLNELLNKMEKGGYVERRPSKKDRRVMIIHLTEKGRNTEQPKTDIPDIFECLKDEELTTFGGYLDRIIDALEEKSGITARAMDEWVEKIKRCMGSEHNERMARMFVGRMNSRFFG